MLILTAAHSAGIYFENHVAAVPICGPSRSSLLLSKFPHNNGYVRTPDLLLSVVGAQRSGVAAAGPVSACCDYLRASQDWGSNRTCTCTG